MIKPPGKWLEHGLRAVLLLLAIAMGVRVLWVILEPLVPALISSVVVLTILMVAVGGLRRR